jgi:hypothetical protein
MKTCSAVVAGVVVMAGALGGCSSPSVWEQGYVGPRPPAKAGDSAVVGRSVTIRNVPWDRVQEVRRSIEAEASSSDVHPDEWPSEKKADVKARLLRGLQVSTDPSRVEILGRSEFKTTDTVRPETPEGEAELAAFARRLGADMVVWSGRTLGKADKIVDRPVTTTSSSGWGRPWDGGRDGHSSRDWGYTDSSTSWVPVRIQADESGFVAFFLRGAN